MRKVLFLVLTSLSGICAFAQKTSFSPVEFSVNAGLGIPTGNFGRADYANPQSGFSKTGAHVNISAVYYVSKNWGIGILAGYSMFGFSAQSLADGYKEDSGTDSTTLYKKGNNRNISVLIGPYYRLKVCKKLFVDLRAAAGYVNTHLAGFEVHYEDYTDNVMTQNETSAGAFGFQAGAGVTYKITKWIGIKANADYFSSKPKMNISYDNFIVNSGRRLDTYNESLGGINATLGIAFSLQ